MSQKAIHYLFLRTKKEKQDFYGWIFQTPLLKFMLCQGCYIKKKDQQIQENLFYEEYNIGIL